MERDIIERYLNNTCTQQEKARVEAWIKHPQAREELTRLWEEFLAEDSAGRLRQEGGERAPSFDDVWARIQKVRRAPEKPRLEKWMYVAAASVGFLLTMGVLLWLERDSDRDMYITVETNRGERRSVILSDGSEILLNAESRLTYPKSMGMHQAAIYIEGEAFFKLAKSAAPRVIKAGGLEARAGGDQAAVFNISAFPSDSTVTVAVDEGTTEIRNGFGPMLKLRIPTEPAPNDSVMPLIKLRPAVVMNKKEFAVVHKQRGEMRVSDTVSHRRAFGWKDGILSFQSASTPELINTLERWYGVDVDVCAGGLPEAAFTAEFDNVEIADAVAQISHALQLRYQIVGRTVYLCGQ